MGYHALRLLVRRRRYLSSTAFHFAAQTAGSQIEAGERVYSDYCSNCHGEGLRNTSGGVIFDLRRLPQ